MLSIRISATDLDAFRWYRDDEGSELADFLKRLRREEPPTEAMLAGTALHKALETAEIGEAKVFEVDGFTFCFDADATIDLPTMRETKAVGEYRIGSVLVDLVGKVDAIHGRRIDDHKFTARYDAERFMNSYQWRVYLDIFGADEFRWNIFEGRESAPRNYLINAFHRLTMHRYPGMRGDIGHELSAFVAFLREYMPERFVEEPPIKNLLAAG